MTMILQEDSSLRHQTTLADGVKIGSYTPGGIKDYAWDINDNTLPKVCNKAALLLLFVCLCVE